VQLAEVDSCHFYWAFLRCLHGAISISPTFFEQLMRRYSFAKKLRIQTRKKQLTKLLIVKCWWNQRVVDFIYILCSSFFVQKCFTQLSLNMFQLCNFWRQNIGTKFTHKMLMKLTPVVKVLQCRCIRYLMPKEELSNHLCCTHPLLHHDWVRVLQC